MPHPFRLSIVAAGVALSSFAAAAAHAGACDPQWRLFASGFDKQVRTFGEFNGVLHAGGSFDQAHGLNAHSIAAWNGSQFGALGGGLVWSFGSQYCSAIAQHQGTLAAGGSFIRAGATEVRNLAVWNSTAWTGLGSETYLEFVVGAVKSMLVIEENGVETLYIGGAGLHRWTGAAWESAGVSGGIEAIIAVQEPDGLALYIARDLGATSSVDRRDPVTGDWTTLGTLDGEARDLASWDDGTGPAIYVCGDFQTVDAVAAKRIARFANGAWSALGDGLNNLAYSLAVWDDGSGERLWVGGQFSFAGNSPASRLASWDGASWRGGGPSINGPVFAIFPHTIGDQTSLWIGGNFTTIGGEASERVARITACAASPFCPGDTNGDGVVDFTDLNTVLTAYNAVAADPNYNPGADFDSDGDVDFADLNVVVSAFNNAC